MNMKTAWTARIFGTSDQLHLILFSTLLMVIALIPLTVCRVG